MKSDVVVKGTIQRRKDLTAWPKRRCYNDRICVDVPSVGYIQWRKMGGALLDIADLVGEMFGASEIVPCTIIIRPDKRSEGGA